MASSAVAVRGSAAADSVGTLTDTLRQVSVTGRRVRSGLRSVDGASVVSMELMHRMPRILGNADPMHYAQMLPGVQTNSEYDAGLHIQGSDNSHNQVSLGGVPIYNAAHMLGFFSVFNPTHFSAMSLSKRASSPSSPNCLGGTLDMMPHADRPPRATGDVSVGPMSSQATVRLPVGNKAHLALSARAAYLNLLYSRWLEFDGQSVNYFFHDYNLTFAWQPDSRNRLWLEAYYGGDDVGFSEGNYGMDTSLRWANAMAALHWQHLSGRLTLRQSLFFTSGNSRFSLDQPTVSVVLPSSISDVGYKLKASVGHFEAGLDATYHYIRPQDPSVGGAYVQTSGSQGRQRAAEVSLWGGWGGEFGRLGVDAGVRSTLFATTRGSRASADPSLALSWRLSPSSKLKLDAWARHQYLVRTGFSDIGLPTEFWFSSGYGQEPGRLLGASLGFEAYFGRGAWRLEAEAYYKRLYHQVEYIGNVFDFVYDDYSLDKSVMSGEGYNCGATLMLERRKGRLTGWVAYAFGLARRRFPGAGLSGWYSASHERPHELNAVATFRLSARWSFGATLVVASGNPFTRIERFYLLSDHIFSEYGPHNAERLPPYARLDLSVNYDFRPRHGRRSGINLSLYNATGHENVLFYRLKISGDSYAVRPFSFALRVLPSINYYLSF